MTCIKIRANDPTNCGYGSGRKTGSGMGISDGGWRQDQELMDEYIEADAPGQGHSPGSAAGRGRGDGASLSQGASHGHGGSSLHTTRLRLIK